MQEIGEGGQVLALTVIMSKITTEKNHIDIEGVATELLGCLKVESL